MSYLVRRLGFYLVAAWASITLAFVIPRLMPGDPATTMMARFKGKLRPEAADALRQALGFSGGSQLAQYREYLGHVARGELGVSLSHYPAGVGEVIAGGLGWTVLLAGVAALLAFALGTALGALAAWRRGGWLDRTAPPLLALIGAFPFFWLAMLALFVFGFALGWFPVRHAYDERLAPGLSLGFVASVVRHALLPGATIVVATLGSWLLGMRSAMLTVLGDDYVTLAEAKGLPPGRVLWRHAARNALLPNVTSFGMALGFVLSGSLLIEIVFSYPGQGYLLLQAVQALDYPLLQGLFLTVTLAVLGANLLVDVAMVWLDPRVRR